MNEEEAKLKLLIDLSLTVQDYEMVMRNYEYPAKDFQKI
jgi:hypothetical protein